MKYIILMQIAQFHFKRPASIITVTLLLHMLSPICKISLSLKHKPCKSQRNFLTDMFVNVDSRSMFYIHIVSFLSVSIPNTKSPVPVGYSVPIAMNLKAKQTFLKVASLSL